MSEKDLKVKYLLIKSAVIQSYKNYAQNTRGE